jgi:hypothetical protein
LGIHKEGDLVSKRDLNDANIQALLEGGHLAEIGSKSNKKLDTKDEII